MSLRRQRIGLNTVVTASLWVALLFCPHALADQNHSTGALRKVEKVFEIDKASSAEYETFSTPRFILHIDKQTNHLARELKSPEEIAQHSLLVLNKTFDDLGRIFSTSPTKTVVLKFLTPQEFRKQTGAPGWTSAMYYRDEITVPLSETKPIDFEELGRALRHEYVHAYVAEVSKFRCPAWLDEGVAQLIEGDANPLLGPALRKWIANNRAIPLDWLHNGFTTLDSAIVPAAYAQSLFATRALVDSHGYAAIHTYLNELGKGMDEPQAFEVAFGMPKKLFERSLTHSMRKWAESGVQHP